MAKASGGTRASNPKSMYGGDNAPAASYPAWMSDAGWKAVLDELANDEFPMGWQDIDPDHRELALMEAGFNGLADDGAEDIIAEISKDSMRSYIQDTLRNQWTDWEVDNDIMITVGYKDGRNLVNEEIQPAKPLTNRQSYSTQRKILDQTVFGRNVDFVMVSGPWGSEYWAQGQRGADRIKAYTGYEKWTNGRGTKRRDYIQDDWI